MMMSAHKLLRLAAVTVALALAVTSLPADDDAPPADAATSTACIVPPEWGTFAPPTEAGGSYTDPVFGTVVTRVTVARPERRTMAEVTNSEISYFNADGSLFFGADEWGKGCLYDGRTGAVVRQLEGVEFRPWNTRWSADARRFYQYAGNQLRLVNADDLSVEVLHSFDEYASIGPAGGEGDVSDDCRYWVLDGGGREMFVYDLVERRKGPVTPFPVDFKAIDYATVTSSGDYVVVLWRSNGPGRYQGTELYDRDWNFVRQLAPWCSHLEFAYDPDGAEIMVCAAGFQAEEFTGPAGVRPGDIIAIRLSDGKVSTLLTMPKWCHQMYSTCNTGSTPQYIYMALSDRGFNPEETWFPYYGEILEIPTDGSQQIRRLVQHRSHDLEGVSPKGTQPDFCINRQGDRIIFESNMGTTKTDLYMFEVTPRETTEQTAPAEQVGAAAEGLRWDAILSAGTLIPPDYRTWQPPREVGACFLDPTFGTTVRRLTVATDFESNMAELANSEISYFSADGALLAATDEQGTGWLYDGRTGAKLTELGRGTMRPWWLRWSDDPRQFYKYEGNEVRRYRVDDLSFEVVHCFAEYAAIGPAGGEGDLSDDRRYWLLDGDGRELFVYDLVELRKGPVAPFEADFKAIDYAAMTCSGEHIIVLWRQTGTGPHSGVELYDRDWNFERQLVPYCPHLEVAYDGAGEEIIVCAAPYQQDEFLAGTGITPGDLISVRLRDGALTLLLDMPKWTHQVYSAANSSTTSGVVYVSLYGRGLDPAESWWPYMGEIVELATDGSGRVRRLCHTRTEPHTERYPSGLGARLAVNPQGTMIAFQSNVGQVKTDLYLLEVPPQQP